MLASKGNNLQGTCSAGPSSACAASIILIDLDSRMALVLCLATADVALG
jgi:hypothetical protein